MQQNFVTFVMMLNAHASVVAVQEGRYEQQTIESGWESDVIVGNSLVDMYAKCGSTNLERVQQDAIRFNVVS